MSIARPKHSLEAFTSPRHRQVHPKITARFPHVGLPNVIHHLLDELLRHAICLRARIPDMQMRQRLVGIQKHSASSGTASRSPWEEWRPRRISTELQSHMAVLPVSTSTRVDLFTHMEVRRWAHEEQSELLTTSRALHGILQQASSLLGAPRCRHKATWTIGMALRKASSGWTNNSMAGVRFNDILDHHLVNYNLHCTRKIQRTSSTLRMAQNRSSSSSAVLVVPIRPPTR